MNVSNLFSNEEKNSIINAIKKAETNTSAEIKVHIESRCKKETLDRAAEVFDMLEMQKTKLRNGILIYVAINSKKCAILGDAGINMVVPDGFWDDCYSILKENFSKEDYSKGIATVIEKCGEVFSHYFKYTSDDVNELSDDISFGD